MLKTVLSFTIGFVIASVLNSCASPVKNTPQVKAKAPEEPSLVSPVKVKKVEAKVEPEEVPQNVIILLSSKAHAYQQIADYLKLSLAERATLMTLSGLPAQDQATVKEIKASPTLQIVALGLKATNAIKGLQGKQIIYTQVFSHKNLMAENIKAVSALPSPEKLFKDWKRLSPGLTRVAIVTGKHLDLFLRRAKKAANDEGIELIIEQVQSDKEFAYKSKKLKSNVDGQWILPDNRVLSGKALKDVMAYASRRGRQIVVFSPKLLSFGGLFFVAADVKAISNGVLQRLNESSETVDVSDNSVLPIMNHTMGINLNIARQLNLTIPPEYQKYVNEN